MAEDEAMPTNITPGEANEERTYCCCDCCEEVFKMRPEWGPETECPNCEERMFHYSCRECEYGTNRFSCNPSFPNHPCDECGKTQEETEADETQEEALQKEKERVERGAAYRQAVMNGIHRNRIGMHDAKTEWDALCMVEGSWKLLRPLIVREMENQHLAVDKILTISWCKHQHSVFERCWQDDNQAALETGVLADRAGTCPYPFGLSHLVNKNVKLRTLRECHLEEGVMPICPSVSINEEAYRHDKSSYDEHHGIDALVTWEQPYKGDDPREIYRTDGLKDLTFFEFLLWSTRVGGLGGQPFNPAWIVEDDDVHAAEPIAYVPTDWCGKPASYQKEQAENFRRWHWLREQMGAIPREVLIQQLGTNMLVCCRCYSAPAEGSKLIKCECGKVLYCSEACQEKDWEVHSFDPTARHTTRFATRVCLSCGKSGTNMKRCSRCLDAFFCDKECQVAAWKWGGHKQICQSRK